MSLLKLLKISSEQLINISWKGLRDYVNTRLHRLAKWIGFARVLFRELILESKVKSSLLEFLPQHVSLENVSSMYALSEAFNATSLRHTCILFILGHFDKLSETPGYLSEFLNLMLLAFCRILFSLGMCKRHFFINLSGNLN